MEEDLDRINRMNRINDAARGGPNPLAAGFRYQPVIHLPVPPPARPPAGGCRRTISHKNAISAHTIRSKMKTWPRSNGEPGDRALIVAPWFV